MHAVARCSYKLGAKRSPPRRHVPRHNPGRNGPAIPAAGKGARPQLVMRVILTEGTPVGFGGLGGGGGRYPPPGGGGGGYDSTGPAPV